MVEKLQEEIKVHCIMIVLQETTCINLYFICVHNVIYLCIYNAYLQLSGSDLSTGQREMSGVCNTNCL